jgi:hypothetical protein
VDLERLHDAAQQAQEVHQAAVQIVDKQDRFLAKLREGVTVLKHGRQGGCLFLRVNRQVCGSHLKIRYVGSPPPSLSMDWRWHMSSRAIDRN